VKPLLFYVSSAAIVLVKLIQKINPSLQDQHQRPQSQSHQKNQAFLSVEFRYKARNINSSQETDIALDHFIHSLTGVMLIFQHAF
jgi:hypothetical protein